MPLITEQSVSKALTEVKVKKVVGSSGIVAEVMKASSTPGITYISTLINRIIQESISSD